MSFTEYKTNTKITLDRFDSLKEQVFPLLVKKKEYSSSSDQNSSDFAFLVADIMSDINIGEKLQKMSALTGKREFSSKSIKLDPYFVNKLMNFIMIDESTGNTSPFICDALNILSNIYFDLTDSIPILLQPEILHQYYNLLNVPNYEILTRVFRILANICNYSPGLLYELFSPEGIEMYIHYVNPSAKYGTLEAAMRMILGAVISDDFRKAFAPYIYVIIEMLNFTKAQNVTKSTLSIMCKMIEDPEIYDLIAALNPISKIIDVIQVIDTEGLLIVLEIFDEFIKHDVIEPFINDKVHSAINLCVNQTTSRGAYYLFSVWKALLPYTWEYFYDDQAFHNLLELYDEIIFENKYYASVLLASLYSIVDDISIRNALTDIGALVPICEHLISAPEEVLQFFLSVIYLLIDENLQMKDILLEIGIQETLSSLESKSDEINTLINLIYSKCVNES